MKQPWLILTACLGMLVGCGPITNPTTTKPDAPIDDQSSHSVELVSRAKLVEQLVDHDVYFNQVGQSTELLLPSKDLFVGYSANLIQDDRLHEVGQWLAQLINSYQTKQIYVQAFIPANAGTYASHIAEQQARKFATFFLRKPSASPFLVLQSRVMSEPAFRKHLNQGYIRIYFQFLPQFKHLNR